MGFNLDFLVTIDHLARLETLQATTAEKASSRW
jgi:hypothetical protein